MKIVFLDAATMGGTSLEPISELGELVKYPSSTPDEAIERVADAEVLIINKILVTSELLDAAPKLKLICEAATGVNNIDLQAAESRGIPVRNVAAYSTASVAQLTFAHILSLVCQSPSYDSFVKDGSYSACSCFTHPTLAYTELAGKVIGIIGMGAIGRRVATIAEAFGMSVVYFSTSGTSHCTDYPSIPLEELLRTADIVSIHAPLDERTLGLIGTEQLIRMKPSAIVVNMGRGGIVDEAALAGAIDAGTIRGAALDVYVSEPLPADSPLLHTSHPERLRFSPHTAWASDEAKDRLVATIAANIRQGW